MPSDNDRRWDRDDRDRDRDRDDDDRPRGRRRDRDDDYEDDRPRRRRADDDYDDDRPRRRPQPEGNGLAVAGLILGILSVFTFCLAGVPAIICSLLAMGKPVGRGMAIVGLLLGTLGTLAGAGGGYWLYTKWEGAKVRMRDSNNMKQVAVAFHNQDSAMNGLRAPYATDNFGTVNTGLSWRVGLLPYVEQSSLYNQFNMREAWDGPTNKSLSSTPIRTYTSPYDDPGKGSSNTPYRVFYGGGALFNEDGSRVSLWNIPDGSSNTILAVHAWDQVPWAAPKDFKYSDKESLPKLGHPDSGDTFQAAFADGSVRSIRKDIPERTLRLLITKADGMPIPAGDW